MTIINCELNSCQFNKDGRCKKEEITLSWDGYCIDCKRKPNILIGINYEKHTWSIIKKQTPEIRSSAV